jgi:N-acetylneuraminic acid mutarotase
MGGIFHEDTILKKCEVYDIAADNWEHIKSMNLKRKDPSAVMINNEFVYVFCGSVPNENERESIERYNIRKNTWKIMPIRVPQFMNSQVTLRISNESILL